MRGLILCGGLGSRLWPVTLSLPKQLIPLAGKPILFYIIDSLIKANIDEIGIVVGNNEELFRNILDKEYSNKSLKFQYIKQNKPLGLSHAVLTSEDFLGDDDFIMVLGDNFYEIDILKLIDNFLRKGSNCHILLKEVEEPKRFGIADVSNGVIKNVIEKPKNPPSNLAITGIYIFDKNILKACKQIKPSWRGEYEITDAIKWLLNNKLKITYDITEGKWEDLGKLKDILKANKYKLDLIECDIKGEVINCNINGKGVIGEKSKVINSNIIGPVYIGKNVLIEDSIIGPYTAIYDGVKIVSSNIENTIILDNCKIKNFDSKIKSSIIESECIIEKVQKDAKEYQIILGRKSKIVIEKD